MHFRQDIPGRRRIGIAFYRGQGVAQRCVVLSYFQVRSDKEVQHSKSGFSFDDVLEDLDRCREIARLDQLFGFAQGGSRI